METEVRVVSSQYRATFEEEIQKMIEFMDKDDKELRDIKLSTCGTHSTATYVALLLFDKRRI